MKEKGASTTPLSSYFLDRPYDIEFLNNAIKVGADINHSTSTHTSLMRALNSWKYNLVPGMKSHFYFYYDYCFIFM